MLVEKNAELTASDSGNKAVRRKIFSSALFDFRKKRPKFFVGKLLKGPGHNRHGYPALIVCPHYICIAVPGLTDIEIRFLILFRLLLNFIKSGKQFF
ncbi:MAG: hypothetical protein IKS18_02195 [Lachnospiraceae bacterium]|nr:hypothetical protein [Lachnospiraceae bacterium]